MADKAKENPKELDPKTVEGGQENGTADTGAEKEGEKASKENERKPWSTKKKVGVGGSIVLALIGGGLWIKKKFFSGGADGNDD